MSKNLDILNNLKIKYNPHAELINGIYVNLNNYNIDKRIEFDQSKRDIFIDRLMTTGVLKVVHDDDKAIDEVTKDEIKDELKDKVKDEVFDDEIKDVVKDELTDDKIKDERKNEIKDEVKDKIEEVKDTILNDEIKVTILNDELKLKDKDVVKDEVKIISTDLSNNTKSVPISGKKQLLHQRNAKINGTKRLKKNKNNLSRKKNRQDSSTRDYL